VDGPAAFWIRGPAIDRFKEALVDRVNETGEVFLSHTRLDGATAIRLAIGNLQTAERHVAQAWALLQTHTAELLARP
jgi:aromatic-L-amino-acid decarboxylase